ncbi:MAG: CPBP family intramembrane metalloprotease [Bacilli bacterium]|nr:CPBP family intramembrane metalloprotease [Bacilli bacterium]
MKEKIKNIIICLLIILSMFVATYYISMFLGFISNDEIQNLIANLIYLIILIYIFRKEIFFSFKNIKGNFKKILNIGFKYWSLGIFIMIVSNLVINLFIFKGSIAENEEMARSIIIASPIYGFISSVIIAPFLEEIIFRVSLKRVFNNKYIYAVFSGIIFGLMHAISGSPTWLDLVYIIPYGALGFAFGLMYAETDNVFTSVIMHALHNLMSFSLVFILLG